MKKLLSLTITAVMLAFGATGAWANGGPYAANMTNGTYGPVGVVTPNSNTGEFEIYNAVNQLLGTTYTNNAQLDVLEAPGNTSVWEQTGNGGYAIIGLGAGANNRVDVYNVATPGTLIDPLGVGYTGNGPLGDGTSSNPYPATGAVFSDGTQFGFDLHEMKNNVVLNDWRSNPTLNSDGMDHLMVYNLPSLHGQTIWIHNTVTNTDQQVTLNNPYFIGFEDKPIIDQTNGSPSDLDYNDLMILVDGVAPVPEPMTVALFGLGLLALVGFGLRRKLAFAR